MDNDPGTIKEMHEEEGREKIKKLQKKIDKIGRASCRERVCLYV